MNSVHFSPFPISFCCSSWFSCTGLTLIKRIQWCLTACWTIRFITRAVTHQGVAIWGKGAYVMRKSPQPLKRTTLPRWLYLPLAFSSKYLHCLCAMLVEAKICEKATLPWCCRQSSGSHCQTSYHSGRSTGSPVQDLPYRVEWNTADYVCLSPQYVLFGTVQLRCTMKREIAIAFPMSESLQCRSIYCKTTFVHLIENFCLFNLIMYVS